MHKALQTDLQVIVNDLARANKFVYDKCGLAVTAVKAETESTEYAACSCSIGGMPILHRSAKITPKKIGQFVTIWKRNQQGITEPFSCSDAFYYIIISAKSGDNFGQFIFPKSVLLEKGILSGNGKEGKRGIRVYPPWDKPTSKQAEKTQQWQIQYFLEIKEDQTTDLEQAKRLFGI